MAWATGLLDRSHTAGDRGHMEGEEDQSTFPPRLQYKERAWPGRRLLSDEKCALFLFLFYSSSLEIQRHG